jgi:aminopeptidase N
VRLDFTTGDETFESETTVTFRCRTPGGSTFVEFGGPAVHVADLNGRALAPTLEGGRLRLDGLAAENSLTIKATGSYSRDGTGINWFRDPVDGRTYLHSMFSEHQAYRGYACFDQPDLKATFAFRVRAPDGWVAVSNTPGTRSAHGEWTFPPTKPMSTYITAIVAGEYHSVHQDHRGIPLGLYCRRSLAEYFDPDEIFEITRNGLDFFERRFGHRYPFGKYDQLFVPEFASGAMENAGCVTHNERMVFRSKVTDAQRMGRAETILHEMAHMWFGDLVTMRWWDDLWLNESFAEYMGYLGVAEATRFKTAWIEFADATKAAARTQDQLPTTHPIVADIPDVEAAGGMGWRRSFFQRSRGVLHRPRLREHRAEGLPRGAGACIRPRPPGVVARLAPDRWSQHARCRARGRGRRHQVGGVAADRTQGPSDLAPASPEGWPLRPDGREGPAETGHRAGHRGCRHADPAARRRAGA